DTLEGSGTHEVVIPLHLAPGVCVVAAAAGEPQLRLQTQGRTFILLWQAAADWALEVGAGRVSPSYGGAVPISRLGWRRRGPLPTAFCLFMTPVECFSPDLLTWAGKLVAPPQHGNLHKEVRP